MGKMLRLTSFGVVQPEQQRDQGRFSRTAGSHHRHDGPGRHQQIEVLEDEGILPGRVGERDVAELKLALQLLCIKDETFYGGAEEKRLTVN